MSYEWLPSYERQRKRKRHMGAEAYERSREGVHGPEELAKDMEQNGDMAELALALELEPKVQEKLKKDVESSLAVMGVGGVFAGADTLASQTLAALQEGDFTLAIQSDDSGQSSIVAMPEGNVSEKIPVVSSLSESLLSGFAASTDE